MSSVETLKPTNNGRRLAGILAAAAMTAACTALPPATWPSALNADHPPKVACTTVPSAAAPVVGTSGQRSPLDMPPVPGGLLDEGGWAVGEYGMTDHGTGGGVGRPLIVRVTGTTMRRVPVPGTTYSSALEDVAATSATDAWAVGFTGRGPLVLHPLPKSPTLSWSTSSDHSRRDPIIARHLVPPVAQCCRE